ncbi:MAG: hypothetical protein ACOYXM_09730 [Actinomycetota bacterium]
MAPDANPLDAFDDPRDIAALRVRADALIGALDQALTGWVVQSVRRRWHDWTNEEPPEAVIADATEAGETARSLLMEELRVLLTADVDAQRSNPLALIRRAVVHPTRVLHAHGVPPVARDSDAERLFPDDTYDLSPASFAEVDPSLQDLGLEWGAAKAHVMLRRRRDQRR